MVNNGDTMNGDERPGWLTNGMSVAVAVVICLLSSCTQMNISSGNGGLNPSSSPEYLPEYRGGTIYVYSNGSWDLVESARQGTVQWVNHRGHRSTASADFTFRPGVWESTNLHGEREYKRGQFLFSEVPETIWPLAAGKSSGYIEVNRWSRKGGVERGYDAYWKCRVEGQEKVTVAAGDFDTWKITCGRYSGSMRKTTANAREYRTWYFAPEISHWVKMERERNTSDGTTYRRQELVAILPGLDSLGVGERGKESLQKFYQTVLERQPSGKRSTWKTEDDKLAVTMTPTKTFRRKKNMVCRQYTQVFTVDGKEESYYGVACRNDAGKWSVPRKG